MEDKFRIILFRVWASIIDGIIIGVFFFVLPSFNDARFSWFTVLEELFLAAYYIYFHARFGQTPGKMILKIKVVDYETGSRMSLQQSIMRYACWAVLAVLEYGSQAVFGYDFGWITALSALLALVFVLSIVADARGRGIHDKIAGTITKDVLRR